MKKRLLLKEQMKNCPLQNVTGPKLAQNGCSRASGCLGLGCDPEFKRPPVRNQEAPFLLVKLATQQENTTSSSAD